MKNYLEKIKNFDDRDIEDNLDEYIRYHNSAKKSSTRYIQNDIRDLDNADLIDIIFLDRLKNILLIEMKK